MSIHGETTLDICYTFLELQSITDIPESDGEHTPAFLDGAFQAYDKFYRKITKPYIVQASDNKVVYNIFSQEKYSLIYITDHQHPLKGNFPDPQAYDTKNNYYYALTAWYKHLCSFFSSVLLPTPLTGEFHVPSMPKIFTREEKNNPGRFRTFKPNLWPLLPNNYLLMISKILDGSKIDPEEKFVEQIPKRDPILYRHHMTSEDQWQSELVPREPDPILYETFEEYESTFIRWANITYNSLKNPILHPAQFGGIIGLSLVKPQDDQPTSIIKKEIPKKEVLNINDEKYSLYKKNLKTPKNLGLIEQKLLELRSAKIVEKEDTREKDQFFYFGVRNSFIEEMERFGAPTIKNNKRSKLEHPLIYTQKYNALTDDRMFFSFIHKISTYDNVHDILFDIFLYDLNFNEITKLQKTTFFAAPLANLIVKDLQVLKYILQLQNYTVPNHKFRISVFLRKLLKTELANLFIDYFAKDLIFFRKFLKCITLTIDPKRFIMKLRKENRKKEPYLSIQLFYYYNQFLDLVGVNQCESALLFAVNDAARELSNKLVVYLNSNKNFVLKTRKKENSITRKMLFSCSSQQIHRILFGNHFLKWANSLRYQAILQIIAHGTAMSQAAFLFIKNSSSMITKDFLNHCSETICKFIGQIAVYLLERSEDFKINYKFDSLLKIIPIVGTSKRKSVVTLTAPFAALVISEKNTSHESISEISAVALEIGKSIDNENYDVFIEQIKGLLVFCKAKRCNNSLAKEKDIMNPIVKNLTATDMTVAHLSWVIFLEICSTRSSLSRVLSYNFVGTMFATVMSSGNAYSLRRVLVFTIVNWRLKDNDVTTKLCSLLYPSIGRIACLIETRHTAFKNNEALIDLITIFGQQIKQLNQNEVADFITAFNRHVDANDSLKQVIK